MKINVLSFTKTMSSLLKANLSLQDALKIAGEIENGKGNKLLCKQLWSKVNEGFLLSNILKSFGKYFSELYISLVGIGEETDTLKDVFERLAEYLKVKKETKTKIIQRLIYPIMVMASTFAVVIVIMLFVFPRLEVIFEAFSNGSDDVLREVSKIRNGIMETGIFFLIFMFILILLVFVYKVSESVACWMDGILLKCPVLGKYIVINQTRDFSFSMKLLCGSYYEFTSALKHSSDVIGNRKYKKAIEEVYEKVVRGESIGKSFESHKEFPSYFITWIKLAEISGNPESVFAEIYDYYSSENQNIINALSVSLEPAFILITGCVILTIISRFVIPVFSLMGNL